MLRFFGPRGDLLSAEWPVIAVFEASGALRFRLELPELEGFLDVAAVGDELWIAAPGGGGLVRRSLRDGAPLGTAPVGYLDPGGRFLQSSTAPHLPVWHGARPVLVRVDPTGPPGLEVPGPGGELILPIADGRWLLWHAGQLRLWRTIGEAWRRQLGDPAARVVDAQLVLDGRLFVLVQQRGARTEQVDSLEHRLVVAQVSDGAPNAQLRLPGVTRTWIAARRGLLLARAGERLSVIDLRFGRVIRELVLPEGTLDLAVDDGMQQLALATADGLALVPPEALAAPLAGAAAAPAAPEGAPAQVVAQRIEAPPEADAAIGPADAAIGLTDAAANAAIRITDAAADAAAELPDDPLVRLDPVTITPTAAADEIARAIELRLQLVGARAAVAIAEAWDTGRLGQPDPLRPPHAAEVGGLLHLASGREQVELGRAVDRLRAAEDAVLLAERARGGRLTPLEVLARDFGLTAVSAAILFALAAPHLRGELARLYSILTSDPGRPPVDEHLLHQLLGASFDAEITRELDADRPLRRFGLVRVGAGERPFAALSIDPLVVRYLANQSPEGEPDQHLGVRTADRDLEELAVPRALLGKALRALASPRDAEPVRIVVRGRTGAGRHTLLAALAARAGRALGVIDVSMVPREPGRFAQTLEAVLRRAMLRGLVPCVDGLELISAESPEAKVQLAAVLGHHPGPLALRLPLGAQVPLEPGYLVLDLPAQRERERGQSWATALNAALERHGIELADPDALASELAGRYRVGPGIIERVCAEVARRPERPADAAAWARELDDAVRQHLEDRLGATAHRVTRLASWADIVLPEDILDSLLELTARVRHRKTVYEQWGFDRSITTARGITALFQGSPGTGKTMVAGVIARDLGVPLYRVDVSRITSKWIGETEKNLGSLFDAAEDGQVMLLFDEADSLFAKR
ncbi:MAG TPA: ATP-binding protein, partial [Kofleriaceae bacterium]|nr:ATP-binding protein [Kofleriaceae bacterium]